MQTMPLSTRPLNQLPESGQQIAPYDDFKACIESWRHHQDGPDNWLVSLESFESLRDQRECGIEDQQLECGTEDEDEDEEGIDFFAQMRVLDGLGFKVVFVSVKEMDGFASPAVTSAH